MNILINNKKAKVGKYIFFSLHFSTYYSNAINYDLLFLIVSIVAPKMMNTPMSKMPLMRAFDEASPKQRVPLTVRAELQNEKHSTRALYLLVQKVRNNPDLLFIFINRFVFVTTHDWILVLHYLFDCNYKNIFFQRLQSSSFPSQKEGSGLVDGTVQNTSYYKRNNDASNDSNDESNVKAPFTLEIPMCLKCLIHFHNVTIKIAIIFFTLIWLNVHSSKSLIIWTGSYMICGHIGKGWKCVKEKTRVRREWCHYMKVMKQKWNVAYYKLINKTLVIWIQYFL